MIMRLAICPHVLDALDELCPNMSAMLALAMQGPRLDNITCYLALQQEAPHKAIVYWCAHQLIEHQQLFNYAAQREAHRAYIKQELESVDVDELPCDLAWAVRIWREHPHWQVSDALRLVHALSEPMVTLARDMQPVIDHAEAELMRLGCKRRRLPIIVAMPCILDQYWHNGRMSRRSGSCGEHYASIVCDIEQVWPAFPEFRDKVIVHEMVHTTQLLDVRREWGDHYALLEGITELISDMVVPGTPSYLAERKMVGRIKEDLRLSDEQIIAISNDPRPWVEDVSVLRREALYTLSDDAAPRFATDQMFRAIAFAARPEAGAETKWTVEPSNCIKETARRLGARVEGLGDPLRNPRVRAAALLMWATHHMQETPSRALRWTCRDKHHTDQLDAVLAWRRDPTAHAWQKDIDTEHRRDTGFWIWAARLALDVDQGALEQIICASDQETLAA
jgi:hypothetical protein